jgi:RNA-directed DNA polymerase
LSPLFAHRLLDGVDKARERRGHRFVRSADESNIDGKSRRAGQRALARGTRFVAQRRPRTVKAAKRAVDRPWRRTFLGFTCTGRRPHRRQGRAQALQALQQEGRQRTCRTRGGSLPRVVQDRRQSRDGW